MRMRMLSARFEIPHLRFSARLGLCATVVLLGTLSVSSATAQQRLSKRYPAGKNVRVELKNISGTITVESWPRDEIKLTATLESPKANVAPRQTGDAFIIDVMADNRGHSSDIGKRKLHSTGSRKLLRGFRNDERSDYRD